MKAKIIVASKNPVKISATQSGFERILPNYHCLFEGVSVSSDVSNQPMSDSETLRGAENRAENAKKLMPGADFWVGIEGGIHQEKDNMQAFAWIVILSRTGVQGKSRTGTFYLPPAIVKLIEEGKELGEADDIVFKQNNSKQKGGAVGLLTGNIIDRASYYEHAMVLALIPFKNSELYQQ